mmetsp:Transcript_18026/g.27932  ORF Transcript_18026/g.27932 Transcript_18026/m.27932 type:complete len:90 (+) Transcript_18026:28-297(+)
MTTKEPPLCCNDEKLEGIDKTYPIVSNDRENSDFDSVIIPSADSDPRCTPDQDDMFLKKHKAKGYHNRLRAWFKQHQTTKRLNNLEISP